VDVDKNSRKNAKKSQKKWKKPPCAEISMIQREKVMFLENIRGILRLGGEYTVEIALTAGKQGGILKFMEADIEIIAVRSAQRGDEDAWRNLFESHFEPVYKYCLNLACGRQDMAEEITQQAFMTAARRIGRFKPGQGTFRAWLLGIAKNRFMKVRAKELRHREHEKQFFKKASEREKVHKRQLFVHEALARLPVHYRLVLEAKYLEGLTVNQIAEANSSTPKAVESLLGRARDKFAQVHRQMLDKYTS
jgi:RNA polymerase sigma-70 factor (ECF subfamily)